MKKNPNKKIYLLIGAIIIVAGYWYSGYNLGKSTSQETEEVVKEETPSISEKEADGEKEEESASSAEKPADAEESASASYEITTVNKKNGDLFSVPDEITFIVSPEADRSRVTLLNAEGITIYTKEMEGAKAAFTVYPDKKVVEGSKGTLVLEGLKNGAVVVSKKIEVKF